jgi:hypothetical protein
VLPSGTQIVRPIRKKSTEHSIEMSIRNSRSSIRYFYSAASVAEHEADVDDGIGRREAPGIRKNILEDLNQAIRGYAHVTAVSFNGEADFGSITVCQSQAVDLILGP